MASSASPSVGKFSEDHALFSSLRSILDNSDQQIFSSCMDETIWRCRRIMTGGASPQLDEPSSNSSSQQSGTTDQQPIPTTTPPE